MASLILPDVNILLAAHRASHVHHAPAQKLLRNIYERREVIALCDVVLSGLLRLATHARIFANPSTVGEAFQFIEELRSFPGAIKVAPGMNHWKIFEELCRKHGITGAMVTDAYIAALAYEHGCIVATFDTGFGRFEGLRIIRPE